MISFLTSAAAGNAVQVLLSPPDGATRWRILRKETDTIAAADDAEAVLVLEGDDKFVLDFQSVENGVAYFYRAYYLIDDAWVASASRSVTPSAQFSALQIDAIDLMRERLDLGFEVYRLRGDLVHPDDHIPVMVATPAFEDAVFPLVTLHEELVAPSERFVGEQLVGGIGYPDEDEIGEIDGWLSRHQLTIICWCLNGDVRRVMRKALESIVIANLNVFEAAGLSQIELQYSCPDDMDTYQVPMYQAVCTLTCIAPTAVETRTSVVVDAVATFNDE